jgi:hypothetical protein
VWPAALVEGAERDCGSVRIGRIHDERAVVDGTRLGHGSVGVDDEAGVVNPAALRE